MDEPTSNIIAFCKNPKLRERVDEIIAATNSNADQKKEINTFFDARIIDLYKSARSYDLVQADMDFSEEEKEEIAAQFRAQLNYWWIEIQSEWIRCNNLLNYKLAIKGERDPVLQAKASICTFLLSPVAKFLDEQELSANLEYLKSLIVRCQYEGIFKDIMPLENHRMDTQSNEQ